MAANCFTMKESSMFYDYSKLWSYNALFYFVIGERGVGKTFGAKKAVLTDFLKNGNEFVYLRRYKTELDTALSNFWGDIQAHGEFDDLFLETKRSNKLTTFTCDKQVCGYAVNLSTSNILKSTAFPNVRTIIFDEFIADNTSHHRYLKNEVNLLLDIVETIGRLRDNIRVVFLGNAVSILNPYFNYFDLEIPRDSEFGVFKDGAIVVNYVRNKAYREAKRRSRFGKLIEGTEYGKFAIDNEWLHDTNTFVEAQPPDSKFYSALILNGQKIGLWQNKNGKMYVSFKYDPNSKMVFSCQYDDQTDKSIFASFRRNPWLNPAGRAFKVGILRFDNLKVKALVQPLLVKVLTAI